MDKRITDAELDVMEVLWGAAELLTAADIAERIDPERDWTLATVKTMLSRLAEQDSLDEEDIAAIEAILKELKS
jgi:predicted transcriptional regulator